MKKDTKKVKVKKNKKEIEIMNTKKENLNKLIRLIGNSVGLAMGIAVIVLFILKKSDTNDSIIMLGIGLFSVALPAIMKRV